MQRAVGAVVLIGMICLGSIVSEWTVRVRSAAHSSPVRVDSLSVVTSVVAPAKTPVTSAPPALPPSFLADPLVYLSHAPADSLDLVPGIGPVLAARIVDARRARGRFATWRDVDAVKGIGPRMIARWQALSVRQ
ncbi:MAG TPA: helix-hairpin-helix domain-containing protein [Candidatus Krumholzibacteria bacterium]|nr:helix-hairpin-helix domain-containing protein [Candidatus Krumholzibacteria bacterium]